LHLVGILFPHINDDARSKSHQIYTRLGHFTLAVSVGATGKRTIATRWWGSNSVSRKPKRHQLNNPGSSSFPYLTQTVETWRVGWYISSAARCL